MFQTARGSDTFSRLMQHKQHLTMANGRQNEPSESKNPAPPTSAKLARLRWAASLTFLPAFDTSPLTAETRRLFDSVRHQYTLFLRLPSPLSGLPRKHRIPVTMCSSPPYSALSHKNKAYRAPTHTGLLDFYSWRSV